LLILPIHKGFSIHWQQLNINTLTVSVIMLFM
jgi:hypothetical protein